MTHENKHEGNSCWRFSPTLRLGGLSRLPNDDAVGVVTPWQRDSCARLYTCCIQQIRIICRSRALCLCALHLSVFVPARACVQRCLWGRNPTSSRVISHAALVTGNGVADGQAECIIDECHALVAPSPQRRSLNFLSEWQKKPRTISLIRSICLTAPYPFNPPIQ